MCTLAVAWQVYEDAPIVVAANRDEALGRPASPPAVRDSEPRVLAPRDEEAGGTWVGVSDRGLFVGVTNRRTDLAGERSRGLLTLDALAVDSAADAAALVEAELAERAYAGFNLVLADAADVVLLEWDGDLRRTALDPGVHVVVNGGLDGEAAEADRVRAALGDPPASAAAWRERAAGVLADHDVGACVHGEGFGTRSSSLVTVGADGDVTYEFADGPPCETPYRRVDADLAPDAGR